MSESENVSFPEMIKIALEHFLSDVNVCLPGKIIKVIDHKKRKISVQPQIKRVYLNNEELEPPIIENVPLMFYGSSKAIWHFPIEVGDHVIVIFSQRSLDNWLSSGRLSTPGERRFFDLSDAIAIPTIQSFKSNHSQIDNADSVYLSVSGNTKLNLTNGIEDLAQLFSDLLDEIIAIQTVGSPPQHVLSPTSITNFTTIKTRISQLLGS